MPFSQKGYFCGIQVQCRDQILINVSMELSRDLTETLMAAQVLKLIDCVEETPFHLKSFQFCYHIQFTTSSRRLDGGAYCGDSVGGKCIFMG